MGFSYLFKIYLGMVRLGNRIIELTNTGVRFVVSQNMPSANIPVKLQWEIKKRALIWEKSHPEPRLKG